MNIFSYNYFILQVVSLKQQNSCTSEYYIEKSCCLFCYDNCLFYETVKENQSADLTTLSTYFHQWRLKLNKLKTCELLPPRKQVCQELHVNIGDTQIPFKETQSYLGYTLHRCLAGNHCISDFHDWCTSFVFLSCRVLWSHISHIRKVEWLPVTD